MNSGGNTATPGHGPRSMRMSAIHDTIRRTDAWVATAAVVAAVEKGACLC